MPPRHELLTREELAERFGVDVRTITNWVQESMPQRTRSGKPVYSWKECREWREQKIREDARATRHAGGDANIKTEMAELRLRALRAEAETAELELSERRGKLVTIDFMRDEFKRIAEKLRARLLSAPPAWAGQLASCTTTVDRQLALQGLIDEILPLLGADADDDGDDDVRVAGEVAGEDALDERDDAEEDDDGDAVPAAS